ncbi:MAG: gamma-glutamylcyclotransferase [Leptospirales bacterium]|nr:gamma-glutamylcyclotransferase [Leptospirales bacterium]
MDEPLLFVYGTLRRGGAAHDRYLNDAKRIGDAFVCGALFDLGGYPALVCGGQQRVAGELYAVQNVALLALDEYEGCAFNDPPPHEYARVIVEAYLNDGSKREAWTYEYRWPLHRARRIDSGDYLKS